MYLTSAAWWGWRYAHACENVPIKHSIVSKVCSPSLCVIIICCPGIHAARDGDGGRWESGSQLGSTTSLREQDRQKQQVPPPRRAWQCLHRKGLFTGGDKPGQPRASYGSADVQPLPRWLLLGSWGGGLG